MNEEIINLRYWNAYRFGPNEFRLCGYVPVNENSITCIITEPVNTIDPKNGLATTADGKVYNPMERMNPTNKIDQMYALDRWCEVHQRPRPTEATDMIFEELTKEQDEQST